MSKLTCLILLGLITASTVFSAAPQHTRELFRDALLSAGEKDYGLIRTEHRGTFTAEGWQATSGYSKLFFELKDALPHEGTVEVTIKGLMPDVTDDWVPFSLWSRRGGTFYKSNKSPGSYAFIKTRTGQLQSGQQSFRFFSCPFYDNYVDGSSEKTYFEYSDLLSPPVWRPQDEHVFKFVWDSENIYFVVDNVELHHEFTNSALHINQVEAFQYILLGSDEGYDAMSGPIYKNLRILVPDADEHFRDVSQSTGAFIDRSTGGQAATWADVNGDGLDDLFVPMYQKANRLFLRKVDGSFEDVAAAWGVADIDNTFAACMADFTGDGRVDLYLADLGGPNTFYVNSPTGTFVDQTQTSGLSTSAGNSVGALAIDVDNDGDLDLFVAYSGTAPQLYINRGNGRFDARTLSDAPAGSGGRAAAGDVNNDGFVDIYYIRRGEPNVLLINDGTGRFTNRAMENNLAIADNCTAPTFLDWDNDGDLDLVITVSSSNTVPVPTILFFENVDGSSFQDRTATMNIRFESYGAIPGDWNNDGWVDLYFPARHPSESARLYTNRGGTFSHVPGSGADKIYADGRGGATVDFDADGKLDLFVASMGGVIDEQEYGRSYLLKNQTDTDVADNRFLRVAVYDSTDQINGLGARIAVYKAGRLNAGTADMLGYREIQPWQGYQSQNSMVQHFGLGTETAADVRVHMPTGQEYIYTNVQANSLLSVMPDVRIPYRQLLVKGDLQRAKVGDFLPDSVTVCVVTQENQPVSGHPVRFRVLQSQATLNGSTQNDVTVTTDQHGLARAAVKLGPVPGESNTIVEITALNAQGGNLINSPMRVTASTDLGDPDRLVKISGDEQSTTILQFCDAPLVVQVRDRYDNPVPNRTVVFQVLTGGGNLEGGATQTQVMSDAAGRAQVRWQLGTTPGTQQLEARSEFSGQPLQNSPVIFQATATQPSLRLVLQSGNYQEGIVNQQLPQPFVVKVSNLQGAAVTGETVTFSVVQGNGRFAGKEQVSVSTNASGLASATAMLGFVAGDTNQVFHATVIGAQGSPAVFKATALPASPTLIREIDGNSQTGKAGSLLAKDFVVQVIDGFNNPVPGFNVLFIVNQGQGTLDGNSQKTVRTDAAGTARVRYRLGTAVGNETVFARADGLEDSPIVFSTIVLPGDPKQLKKISGDNQRGDAGQALPQPLVVAVSDTFDNPILNHSVIYTVTQGDGRVNGTQQYTTVTDLNGQASATLVLGVAGYLNEVRVQSSHSGTPLANSPLIFRATTGPGTPDSLLYVSGNYQTGRINSPLPKPFRVRVTDSNGIPVQNHDVHFLAITSGANFSGQTSRTVKTDADGIAQVIGSIGSNIGDNIYVYEVRAYEDDVPLFGKPEWPIRFFASARLSTGTRIVNATQNSANLAATVGSFLADTIKVRVLDADGLPAAGQPVVFRVYEGSAMLEGDLSSRNVISDAQGIAAVRVKMGTTPGISRIRATANNGVNDLQNSPLTFSVTAGIGVPAPARCTLTADSTAVADGSQIAHVRVGLKDAYGNPVPGKTVNLFSKGLNVTILQPAQPTDAEGNASGSVASIRSGWVEIWSQVDGNVIPEDTVRIRFLPGSPTQVTTFGSGKVGEMGKLLPDSVGVVVKDQFGNPVPGVTVNFGVIAGGGSLVDPGPYVTNSQGIAWVHWILGNPGEQVLEARVPGVTAQPRTISAIALASAPTSLTRVHGNQQIGLVNQTLPDSFKVVVHDKDSRPIPGIMVQYTVMQGQASLLPNALVTTNLAGEAAVLLRAGGSTGLHTVIASVNGLAQTVEFTCIIQAQNEIVLERVDGNGQSARPNRVLNNPLQVRTRDAFNRPLASVKVVFEVVEGGGTVVSDQPMTTDGNGEVSAEWRLGMAGVQRLQVRPFLAGGEPVEFTATILNAAPVISVPADTTIENDQLLSFTVYATDPDDDAITFGARNLPAGAYFDSTYSYSFSWQPARNQVGTHTLTFIARDEYGATSSTDLTVTVQAINRAPVILNYEPVDTLLTFVYGETKFFSVMASDLDGDELTYRWRANGVYAGDSNTSVIYFDSGQFGEEVLVEIDVDDGLSTTSVRWHLTLLGSLVELSLFETQITDNQVVLLWETTREEHNLGFWVLRSRSENGTYERLTAEPIAPNAQGKYRFVDSQVQAGENWFYKLVDLGANGVQTEHGAVSAQLPLPMELRLAQNYPNPFNPETTIAFELPRTLHVSLAIFNISGQLVDILCAEELSPGYHKRVWRGTDRQGVSVPSGVYLYRLTTPEQSLTRKLLLSK
ncbi:Ig-like domain-containing protein [candidate division KSB1 bacterium]|nr:Ig-like domain-containing protein [candidate division KSB1 bacterium]